MESGVKYLGHMLNTTEMSNITHGFTARQKCFVYLVLLLVAD